MEYSPPPLFKQGASARFKMMVFACISIALLFADSRMGALSVVRQGAGIVLYPLQQAALLPRDAIYGVGSYFSTVSSLQKQVDALKQQQIASSMLMQQAQLHQAENNQLRKLLDARERVPGNSLLAEIMYDARDVFTRKVILNRGTQQGVALGLPVIDNQGVVGQITRVFPFTSEVTLLTDKEQAIPVQVLRNGLRSVAYGRGQSGALELRFIAPNADVQVGDILITSGIDGVYPAGLAVARVMQVENNAAGAFGRVVCQPLAGIERNTQLLILTSLPEMLPRPPEEDTTSKTAKKKKEAKDAAAPAAAAPVAPTPAIPAGQGVAPTAPGIIPANGTSAAPRAGTPASAAAAPGAATPRAGAPAGMTPTLGAPPAAAPRAAAPPAGQAAAPANKEPAR